MKSVLTAATALAFFVAPAFAQSDPTDDRQPEIVPGVENNDSDTDDVTGAGATGTDGDGTTNGTTTTETGATSTTVDTSVTGPGENEIVPGAENNDSDEIVEGQNDPATTGAAGAGATTTVAPGTVLVPGAGAESAGGSVGVTATDDGEASTSSGGVVPGQTPN